MCPENAENGLEVGANSAGADRRSISWLGSLGGRGASGAEKKSHDLTSNFFQHRVQNETRFEVSQSSCTAQYCHYGYLVSGTGQEGGKFPVKHNFRTLALILPWSSAGMVQDIPVLRLMDHQAQTLPSFRQQIGENFGP